MTKSRCGIKKLVTTLNKACDKAGLTSERLVKAFEVWYPKLEAELEQLRDATLEAKGDSAASEIESPKAQEILEEILELSRINQKLIRNPETSLGVNLGEMTDLLKELIDRAETSDDPLSARRVRRLHPVMMDELLHMSLGHTGDRIGIQMALALIRHEFPWIYDTGVEAIKILRSRRARDEKQLAIEQFRKIIEFSSKHPMMREIYGHNKESRMVYRRLLSMLMRAFEENARG